VQKYLGEIHYLIHLLVFLVIAILNKDLDVDVNQSRSISQWVLAPISLGLGILLTLFLALKRVHQINDHTLTVPYFALFFVIQLISIFAGLSIFWVLSTSVHLIWVSFTMLPLAVASFLIIAENLLSTSQVVGGGRVNQLVAP
jgi:hypothetical protein